MYTIDRIQPFTSPEDVVYIINWDFVVSGLEIEQLNPSTHTPNYFPYEHAVALVRIKSLKP